MCHRISKSTSVVPQHNSTPLLTKGRWFTCVHPSLCRRTLGDTCRRSCQFRGSVKVRGLDATEHSVMVCRKSRSESLMEFSRPANQKGVQHVWAEISRISKDSRVGLVSIRVPSLFLCDCGSPFLYLWKEKLSLDHLFTLLVALTFWRNLRSFCFKACSLGIYVHLWRWRGPVCLVTA